jgi:Cu-Zn family superoxide dismutase
MSTRSAFATVGLATVAFASLTSSPAAASAGLVDTERQPLSSYNTIIVPAGATARVRAVYTASDRTVVTLNVWGLAPNREYGAHAHKYSCSTTDPTAAGGHFQYVEGGASDPAYANPDNEIWLDFTTDGDGNGAAQTVVEWQFPAERRAQSVIIHDHHTATGPDGSAGTAGPRYGCLTVLF